MTLVSSVPFSIEKRKKIVTAVNFHDSGEKIFQINTFLPSASWLRKNCAIWTRCEAAAVGVWLFVFNLGWRMFKESRGAGCFSLALMYDNSSKLMETQSRIHPVRKCDSDTLFRLPAFCFRFISDETRLANVCERRRLRGQTRQEVVKNICHEMQTHWITSDFLGGGPPYPTPSSKCDTKPSRARQPRIPSHFDSSAVESLASKARSSINWTK